MTIDRRSILKFAGLVPLISAAARVAWAADDIAAEKVDYTLRIATDLVELAPKHIVSTVLYNQQFPGPLLRFTQGRRAIVDIHNDTDTPELVHWHGQMIPSEVDGAAEEGSPFVPPHGTRRIAFVPKPAGFRFVHSHVIAGDPVKELQLKGKAADEQTNGAPKGFEVGYELFAINGRMLGHGEPIRVKRGERVLFHILNASAGETRSLALPGHVFRVVALDGNPVPTPADVPVLWLGTAERISAIVEMKHPGVWVLGDLADDDRRHGMGIVVEYAGQTGQPQWLKPKPFHWDYARFGGPPGAAAAPNETIEMTIVKRNAAAKGFNLWTLNGQAFSMHAMQPMYEVHAGRRYRLRIRNASDDVHPLHLHRHSFELTRIHGKQTSGVMKDVVMLGGFQELEVEFLADNPGLALFHCHQQLHMDFGFMALFKYV